ncbi:MAG: right-handed parallel beta-helix repeat-containing protein [Anaerolineae bacterium]|nr:right-handed parallel beta-helix repeat-containing protein [Anaerolineae bacterium]
MSPSRAMIVPLVFVLCLLAFGLGPVSAAEPGQTFTVNSASDVEDEAGCTPSHCTLREAILAANSAGGTDTIAFAILSQGTPVIQVGQTGLGPLPTIADPVVIDATTQSGGRIELNGAAAGTDANGLVIEAGASRLVGLVINRFDGYGVVLDTLGGNIVEGTIIGADVAGTADLGNRRGGVLIRNSPSNRIGGTTAAARNLIAGNGNPGDNAAGVEIVDRLATGNQIQGNYIGVTFNGLNRLGNQGDGVRISTSNNTVGGTAAGAGNVIAANDGHGIHFVSLDATQNHVEGNLIGTNANGTAALGNGQTGIYNEGGRINTIGGTASGARNVIAGNGSHGLFIVGSQVTVQGNLIGTNAAGDTALPNSGQGMQLTDAVNVTIGGTTVGARNVVAGNTQDGIALTRGSGTVIQGNWIGRSLTGGSLGNGGAGISLFQSSTSQIGGTAAGAGNIIVNNAQEGVVLRSSGTANSIRRNSINTNGGLGIDLGGDGVTPNDPLDADVGINALQNFPFLTGARAAGGGTTFEGVLNSRPNVNLTIEFFVGPTCDPSTFGEGDTYVGSTTVLTNGSGAGPFNTTLPVVLPDGLAVTATATDSLGNTSEFSRCIAMGQSFTLTSVTGRVDMQARADDSLARVEAAGQFVYTQADGSFSMSLPQGTYLIRASHPGYLSAERQVTVGEAPLPLPTVFLLGGDADNNGTIGLLDLLLLGRDYGLEVPPGDVRGDINGNGLVDLPDLLMMGANYGLSAPQPWPGG